MANAILMAAGLGTRMLPITETIPKPLVQINNIPMIETVIVGLQARGIEKIVVVVGYLADQFSYLREKYNNVQIIKNDSYETINNISSVYCARDILLQGDCFICESDVFVSDKRIFLSELDSSCYYGKLVKGYSDDWVFEQDINGIITRIGKGGVDCYNMTGIAYFKKEDAARLSSYIGKEYGIPGYENLFWDEVVNKYIKEFNLIVHPVSKKQIVEIDTVDELEAFRQRM